MGLREKLKRELKLEALTRLEDAAKTIEDFENLAAVWDKLDSNRERNERRNEIPFTGLSEKTSDIDDLTYLSDTIIPPPIKHRLWRQLMSGDFHDAIYECPFELHELVSNVYISELLKNLNDNQKKILYFMIIRQWSPQKIASLRGQTDRNVRKVYNTAVERIRRGLSKRKPPLTTAEKNDIL